MIEDQTYLHHCSCVPRRPGLVGFYKCFWAEPDTPACANCSRHPRSCLDSLPLFNVVQDRMIGFAGRNKVCAADFMLIGHRAIFRVAERQRER